MTIQELYKKLSQIGLRVVWDIDKKWASVGSPSFANPLIWFDAYSEDYHGEVTVKSINASLFTAEQIKKALMLVDEFLSTPLQDRGLS